MANGLKYSITTETETLRKGNFWLAVGDVQKPFGTYYTAIVPPSGGYSIYQNKPSDGPAIYVANSDAELIQYTKLIMGTTFATGPSALNWYNSQTDKMVTNIEYPQIVTNGLLLNLDAGFTPSYPREGTSWYDTGPTGFTAYLINGPSFGASGYGNIILDGTNDLITCDLSGNTSNSYTFSMMLNTIGMTAGTLDRRSIFGVLNSSQSSPRTFRQFNMEFWGNSVRSYRGNGGTGSEGVDFFQYNTGAFVTPNSLNQIAVTVYSTGSQFYINGVLAGTLSTPSNLVAPFTTIVIGSRSTTPVNVWAGNVYQFSAYNRNLSSTEIFQNYQAMLPRLLGQNIVTSGMVQYLNAGYSNSYPGSGTTWTNVAGVSGGNGTLTNGPTYSPLNGGSIVFDGTDDYVNLGTQSLISTDFTINLWFRSSINSLKEHFILSLGYSSFSSLVITMDTQNDGTSSITTYYRDAAGVVTGRGALNSVFLSLAIVNFSLVRKNGVNTPYLNGIPQTLRIFTENVTLGALNYVLGYAIPRNKTSAYMQGNIYSSSIYNIGLNSSEILQNYQASLPQVLAENIVTNGMVAYYDAGYFTSYPATGSSWYDVGGVLAATGALTNGPTYSATGGGSIAFDGADDYILVNNGIYSLSGGTLTLWVMRTGSGLSVIGSYGGSGNQRSPTFYFDGVSSIAWEFGSLTARNTGVNFTLNQWFNLSLTYDSNFNVLVYVNGNQVGSGTSLNPGSFWNQFTIGRYGNYGSSYLNGLISLVRIYNRPLTTTEVLQNYNAQKSRFGI